MPDVDGVDWLMFLHALPPLALMACFALAGRNVNNNPRRAARLLAVAASGMLTLLVVETGCGFYNIRVGERHVYLNRLWYIDKIGPERGDHLLYGYIGPDGAAVIPPKFDEAGPFCEGLAAVKKEGLYGFVEKIGRVCD